MRNHSGESHITFDVKIYKISIGGRAKDSPENAQPLGLVTARLAPDQLIDGGVKTPVVGSRASTILRTLASSVACPAAFFKPNINSARRSASGWPLLGLVVRKLLN